MAGRQRRFGPGVDHRRSGQRDHPGDGLFDLGDRDQHARRFGRRLLHPFPQSGARDRRSDRNSAVSRPDLFSHPLLLRSRGKPAVRSARSSPGSRRSRNGHRRRPGLGPGRRGRPQDPDPAADTGRSGPAVPDRRSRRNGPVVDLAVKRGRERPGVLEDLRRLLSRGHRNHGRG